MRHIVMMRLKEGVFTDEAEQEFRDTFDALKEALPEDILSATVYRNIVKRAQNMTVMVEMKLRDADSLPKYLNHPLHRALGEKYNPSIEAIGSFDCEDGSGLPE